MSTTTPAMPAPARWYCISRDGMATLCASEQDAADVACQSNATWPRQAPHRAVQLVEAQRLAELEREVERLRPNAERYEFLRHHEVDSYIASGSMKHLDEEIDAARKGAQHAG